MTLREPPLPLGLCQLLWPAARTGELGNPTDEFDKSDKITDIAVDTSIDKSVTVKGEMSAVDAKVKQGSGLTDDRPLGRADTERESVCSYCDDDDSDDDHDNETEDDNIEQSVQEETLVS